MDTRYVIVGAGCAGLSLAWHLLDAGTDPRELIVIDARIGYTRDRTWCFFDVEPHPFEALITHRWDRWRVRAGGDWIERSAPRTSYAYLPADAFYRAVLARLDEAGVDLRLGVEVGSVTSGDRDALVQTSQGPIRAEAVFDSRPPVGRDPSEVSLLQHFTGWEVRCEAPRFDPDVATLMDFPLERDQGLHFYYELPFDRHTALIEATWFDDGPIDPAAHRAALERRLEGVRFEVRHTETGVIPMTSTPFERRIGRVYPIGLAGGMAKPSTGYAFLAIQRYSAALAARLAREPLPEPPELRSWLTRAQDHVFLSYLARHPDEAHEVIIGLFERVDPGRLARFLNDRVTPAESLRVMLATPIPTMTNELLRSSRLWLRR